MRCHPVELLEESSFFGRHLGTVEIRIGNGDKTADEVGLGGHGWRLGVCLVDDIHVEQGDRRYTLMYVC